MTIISILWTQFNSRRTSKFCEGTTFCHFFPFDESFVKTFFSYFISSLRIDGWCLCLKYDLCLRTVILFANLLTDDVLRDNNPRSLHCFFFYTKKLDLLDRTSLSSSLCKLYSTRSICSSQCLGPFEGLPLPHRRLRTSRMCNGPDLMMTWSSLICRLLNWQRVKKVYIWWKI